MDIDPGKKVARFLPKGQLKYTAKNRVSVGLYMHYIGDVILVMTQHDACTTSSDMTWLHASSGSPSFLIQSQLEQWEESEDKARAANLFWPEILRTVKKILVTVLALWE